MRRKVDPFTLFYLDSGLHRGEGRAVQVDRPEGRPHAADLGLVDIFSPNDNLNSRDFSDPLDFTRKVPNEMIEIDAYPNAWLTLNLVWVPIFQPSMLPPSAPLAFGDPEQRPGLPQLVPRAAAWGRRSQPAGEPLQDDEPVLAELPDAAGDDLPAGLLHRRLAGGVPRGQVRSRGKGGDLDIDLNYYYGRFGFPVAYDASVQVGRPQRQDDVATAPRCMYPRMQVARVRLHLQRAVALRHRAGGLHGGRLPGAGELRARHLQ